MPNLTLRSERQIQTKMLNKLLASLGLNDLNSGSVMDVLTQAAAQSDFSLYYQIAQVSRLNDLDALTGSELDLKAFEFGLERLEAVKATGLIDILRPSSFVKVSTTFYAGLPAPVAGGTLLNVNDASHALYGTSGTLVVGRGTNNEEEVTYSVAPTDNTNYWTFVLDNPLVNNHSALETIILKQGTDEIILAGTIVIVPATGTSEEIQFETQNDEVLLAGEDRVRNVEIIAVEPGSDSNIAVKAITGSTAFTSPPFTGARAENNSKITTGGDRETDDQLRDRIKAAIQSLSKGVKEAIKNAIVGLLDPETAKRVVSANIVLPVDEVGDVKVYIDDGTGYEPTFESKGFEVIKASATGGEQRFQLDIFPVTKAQIENNLEEPYDLSSGILDFSIEVANLNETISFNPADFRFPDIASAEEVAAAINDKSTLFEARTSQSGIKVVITAKADINENIRVTGGAANAILGFPTDRKDTINLYRDDIKLTKDGITATLDSGNTAPYNLQAIGAYPHTLTIVVDGKTANPQTATINLVDVVNPAAVTALEIVEVLNRDLAGVTATAINSNSAVRLESNIELSNKSKLLITGGTMNDSTDGLDFSTIAVVGANQDYKFNRELGILELTTPLVANQSLTVGSLFTRGKLRAALPELYSPGNGQTLVISVDGGSDQTVTFDATFAGGKTALETANFMNLQLLGATVIVREIGGSNFVEINTNSYDPSIGSIEIKSSSTANAAFSFELDTEVESDVANKAYRVSGNAGPYDFADGDNLVVVVDDDIVNGTFAIDLTQSGIVTTANSTTEFSASALENVFENASDLEEAYLAFSSGDNSLTADVITISDQSGGVARYTLDPVPGNFSDYTIGDLANLSGFDDSDNDLNAVITNVGADWIEVENPGVQNASSQTGTVLLMQRREILSYDPNTGDLEVAAAFSDAPAISDTFILLPRTTKNLVDYLNNTKVTSLSTVAEIESVDQGTKVQITSKSQGSDGYIQVTGGSANSQLDFETEIYRGIAAYSYWVGLTKLVHKTIYGDDTDLVAFPGIGAAGVLFRVLSPTVKDLNVTLDVTLNEGVSISALENEIKSAVTGYVNNLGVGDDVVLERIRAAVIAINGIIDVELIEPTLNIPIADNELARVADTNILIG